MVGWQAVSNNCAWSAICLNKSKMKNYLVFIGFLISLGFLNCLAIEFPEFDYKDTTKNVENQIAFNIRSLQNTMWFNVDNFHFPGAALQGIWIGLWANRSMLWDREWHIRENEMYNGMCFTILLSRNIQIRWVRGGRNRCAAKLLQRMFYSTFVQKSRTLNN